MKQSESLSQIIQEAAFKDIGEPEYSEFPDLEQDLDLGKDLEQHRLYYDVEAIKQALQESKQVHSLRIDYAGNIFILICVWLLLVVATVYLDGFAYKKFDLSDNILIAFITSTTVSVLGLFVVVAKWMFPSSNGNGKD